MINLQASPNLLNEGLVQNCLIMKTTRFKFLTYGAFALVLLLTTQSCKKDGFVEESKNTITTVRSTSGGATIPEARAYFDLNEVTPDPTSDYEYSIYAPFTTTPMWTFAREANSPELGVITFVPIEDMPEDSLVFDPYFGGQLMFFKDTIDRIRCHLMTYI